MVLFTPVTFIAAWMMEDVGLRFVVTAGIVSSVLLISFSQFFVSSFLYFDNTLYKFHAFILDVS